MRVLVTGGSGYLGSAIVRALARAGHEPIVFARHASSAGLPGRAIDGDVRDTPSVTAAAAGTDAIVHSAALVAQWRRDPSEFDAINVGGLQSAFAAARAPRSARGLHLVVPRAPAVRQPARAHRKPLSADEGRRARSRPARRC